METSSKGVAICLVRRDRSLMREVQKSARLSRHREAADAESALLNRGRGNGLPISKSLETLASLVSITSGRAVPP
jgi:hypothetical protein